MKGNRVNHPKKYPNGRKRWLEPNRKAYMKEYYKKNKGKIKKRTVERLRERYHADPEFRIKRLENRKRWGEKNKDYITEYRRLNVLYTNGGRIRVRKRKFEGFYELCGKIIEKRPFWHHWDDQHPEKGLWLCGKCHWLAESVEYDPNQQLMDKYKYLKESM